MSMLPNNTLHLLHAKAIALLVLLCLTVSPIGAHASVSNSTTSPSQPNTAFLDKTTTLSAPHTICTSGPTATSSTYDQNSASSTGEVVSLTNTSNRTYQVSVSGPSTYTYEWQLDAVTVVADGPTTSYTVPVAFSNQTLSVIVRDGSTIVNTTSTVVAAATLLVDITRSGTTLTATVTSNGAPFVSTIAGVGYTLSYQWFDASMVAISGATSASYTYTTAAKYGVKVTATPTTVGTGATFTQWKSYTQGVVIYVSTGGNDANTGLSTGAAVKTLMRAYELLPDSATWDENNIVLLTDINAEDVFKEPYNTNSVLSTISSSRAANIAKYSKNTTITRNNHILKFNSTYSFNGGNYSSFLWGNTRFENIILSAVNGNGNNSNLIIYCQGHDIYVGSSVNTMGSTYSLTNKNLGGLSGVQDYTNSNTLTFKHVQIFGGWVDYNADYSVVSACYFKEQDTCHITVLSGNFARILGACRNSTLNNNSRNIFGHPNRYFNVIINVGGAAQINAVNGGQSDGTCYTNSTINILGNCVVWRVLGGTLGVGRKETPLPESPLNSYYGSSTINISGGTVNEVFGGSLGRINTSTGVVRTCDVFYYGKIRINISGGNIRENIYAGGAGGVSGYDVTGVVSNGDPYVSYANGTINNYNTNHAITTTSEINIYGGTISCNVYGAGYGYTPYLKNGDSCYATTYGGSFFGNTAITISGGAITGNVFGGGCGTDAFVPKFPKLAQLFGNSTINMTGGTLTGNIFGGGDGIMKNSIFYPDMAKTTGNSTINISGGNISSGNNIGNIYGGGNKGQTVGNPSINISGAANIPGAVFGGGNGVQNYPDVGLVTGSPTITLATNATIVGNIYGGGNLGRIANGNTTINITGGNAQSNIFGGGNGAQASMVGNTFINVSGGTVAQNVYGGGNLSVVTGTTHPTVNGGTVSGSMFGGGNQAVVTGSTYPTVSSGTVTGSMFGGGKTANVDGSTYPTISGGLISGNVFGGGDNGSLTNNQSTNITMSNGTVSGSVFGGGNGSSAAFVGTSNITMSGGTVSENVFGGGNQAQLTGSTHINMSGGDVTENVFGGGNQAQLTGHTYINMSGGRVHNNMFGGGNDAIVTSDTHVTVTGPSIIDVNLYGGGQKGAIGGSTYVQIGEAE